jgi:hypothetical protein
MASEASLTLRAALEHYFAANGLPADGGYEKRWVVIRVGPVPVFAFPNSAGRRRIVRAHDLHHVLTGYRTDIRGEGEIAAWEIGAGVRDRAALQLELRVLGFALVRWPRALFDAFRRGRRSRNLLDRPVDDALLARSVGEVRRELGIDRAASPTSAADRRAFLRWAALAAAIVWGPLVPIGLLLWWWLGSPR